MLEIELVSFEDLTEEEKKDQPDNGCGKKSASYLRVTYGGFCVGLYSDAMEPEDATFNRDLGWIADAIEAAYEYGKQSK